MKAIKLNSVILILLLIITSCVEEIDFVEVSETFESALVIDAVVTNELKQQKIILSRTYAFKEDGPNPETNATVILKSGLENHYFNETEPGIYVSEEVFSAQPNVNYQLLITTNDGREYESTPENLTQNTPIDEIYASRAVNDYGIDGVTIYVDSFDPTANSNFYRYEYEETYKIISPKWSKSDLIIISSVYPNCEVALVPREEEERTCYNTVNSLKINLKSTVGLSEDRVLKHPVRFIETGNFIMSYRYSILVKQYIQSQAAFEFIKSLIEFSEGGSLFSQIQPGNINGNIISKNHPQEKVLGFFEVSSVSTKRFYFNFTDFYPNEARPFRNSCPEFAPIINLGHPTDLCGPIMSFILTNELVYFKPNEGEIPEGDIHIMVPRNCGDCTALGSNVVPGFWEE